MWLTDRRVVSCDLRGRLLQTIPLRHVVRVSYRRYHARGQLVLGIMICLGSGMLFALASPPYVPLHDARLGALPLLALSVIVAVFAGRVRVQLVDAAGAVPVAFTASRFTEAQHFAGRVSDALARWR